MRQLITVPAPFNQSSGYKDEPASVSSPINLYPVFTRLFPLPIKSSAIQTLPTPNLTLFTEPAQRVF